MKTHPLFNYAFRHEDVLRKQSTAPPILNLGVRWRWVVSSTPRPFYPLGKNCRYSLDSTIGGNTSNFTT